MTARARLERRQYDVQHTTLSDETRHAVTHTHTPALDPLVYTKNTSLG